MTNADVREGRWQDVLGDVECDSVITDVPYSERTIAGQRSGTVGYNGGPRATIRYAGLTEQQTRDVAIWATRISRRWFVSFCDHMQWVWLNDEALKADFVTFQPIPWVKPDGTPRFTADGPAASSEWIMVSRRRGQVSKRFRQGHYIAGTVKNGATSVGITGTKPIDLMRAVVRDYSEPGDLVCDPFLGSGTTALAALMEGRRFVGAEEKPEHMAIVRRRLARGYTPGLFAAESVAKHKQGGLP